jgi:hypothetical protein
MVVFVAQPAWAGQESGSARGEIVGTVADATSGWPVAQAEVRVLGRARGTHSDATGRFRLVEVEPGVVTLEVRAPGYEVTRLGDVVVSSGKPTSVLVELRASPLRVAGVEVVPSSYVSAQEAPVSTQRLRAEEIRRSAGAQEDVVRAVSVLPGVAPTAVHSNMLVVRGGAPFENLFVVDGLEVPDLTHFSAQGASGGQSALINLDFVERVDFWAGGFGARYGDGLGSVTSVRLREGLRERHAGELNLAITGVGGAAEGPLGAGSYLLGVRRSYLDLLLDAAGESFFTRYWDANLKVAYPLGVRDRLSWTLVGALDAFGFNVETADDAYDAALLATNVDQYFTGLSWSHLSRRARFELTAGQSARAFDTYQNDTLATAIFRNRSAEVEHSLRAVYSRAISDANTLDLGITTRYHSRLRYDVWLPGHLRPDAAGMAQPLAVDTSFRALRMGAFVETGMRWSAVLSTRLGARLDYYGHLRDALRFSPRLSATWAVEPDLTLNLSGGRYWQSPSFIWMVGDPGNARRLRPMRVDQAVLGLQKLLPADVKLQVEAYYKRYGEYPARLWHEQAVVAPGDFETVDADVPFGLEPLESAGTGRAHGLEFFLQKRLNAVPLYGTASVSFGRAWFGGLDGIERRGSYDVPVIANLALGWKPGPHWDVGLRWRAASGRPRSPFISSGPYAGRLDFARYNEAERMPAFHTLDLRIDRRWTFQRLQLTTYLDIQDVYNRNNPIGYYWDERRGAGTYEEAIGFLPSVGINVEF